MLLNSNVLMNKFEKNSNETYETKDEWESYIKC